MHPENAIDNGDFIKILVYKFNLMLNFINFIIGITALQSLP